MLEAGTYIFLPDRCFYLREVVCMRDDEYRRTSQERFATTVLRTG